MSEKTQTRKILAFTVATDDPEESTIQFATTNVAARRQGADVIGTDFGYVTCRRAPWADQYADQGSIPAKAYIDAGWWFGCGHCGTRCDSDATHWDEDSGEDVALNLVFDGPTVYCSAECKAKHDAEVSARNAKFEEFKVKVVAEQPGLTFKEFTGGYPWCANRATFTFPGAQYGGSVSDTEETLDLSWYVSNGDKEAWDAFISQSDVA